MTLTNAESFSLMMLIATPICVVTVVVMNKLLTEPVLSFEEQDEADRKALTPNTFAQNLAQVQPQVTQKASPFDYPDKTGAEIDKDTRKHVGHTAELIGGAIGLAVVSAIYPPIFLPGLIVFGVRTMIYHYKNT